MEYGEQMIDQNGMPIPIAQHDYQMNLILELIPQEIVENYKMVLDEPSNKKKKKPKRNDQSFVSSSKLESSDP
jgi:hypothetical protein